MAHGSLRAIDWATALRRDVSRIQRDPANVAPRHRVFATVCLPCRSCCRSRSITRWFNGCEKEAKMTQMRCDDLAKSLAVGPWLGRSMVECQPGRCRGASATAQAGSSVSDRRDRRDRACVCKDARCSGCQARERGPYTPSGCALGWMCHIVLHSGLCRLHWDVRVHFLGGRRLVNRAAQGGSASESGRRSWCRAGPYMVMQLSFWPYTALLHVPVGSIGWLIVFSGVGMHAFSYVVVWPVQWFVTPSCVDKPLHVR